MWYVQKSQKIYFQRFLLNLFWWRPAMHSEEYTYPAEVELILCAYTTKKLLRHCPGAEETFQYIFVSPSYSSVW